MSTSIRGVGRVGVTAGARGEAPERFVQVLSEFIETTTPARITAAAHHVLRQT